MQKLAAVEEAKALFEEAKEWGVWRWLTEKSRARQSADAAWKALGAREKTVRASWSPELKRAYKVADTPDIVRLKRADREAEEAHEAAEKQFDDADRRLSTSMARDGCQMAIDAWEMRERFIRRLEALGKKAISDARA